MEDFIKKCEKLPKNIEHSLYQDLCKKLCPEPELYHSWDSASLCLLTEKEMIFIQRSAEVPKHKNQIAFVGGHKTKAENDPLETALREYEEEFQLDQDLVKKLGIMPHVRTRGTSVIIPAIGYVDGLASLEGLQSNGEWTHCLAYPLTELFKEELWYSRPTFGDYRLYEFSLKSDKMQLLSQHDGQASGDFILWGATAQMVYNLMRYYYEF